MLFKILLALIGIMAAAYSSEITTAGSGLPAVSDSADKTKSLGDITCSPEVDNCITPCPSSEAATLAGTDPWDSLVPKVTATFAYSDVTSTTTYWGVDGPSPTTEHQIKTSCFTYRYTSSSTIVNSPLDNPTFTSICTTSTPVIVTENPDPTMSALSDPAATITSDCSSTMVQFVSTATAPVLSQPIRTKPTERPATTMRRVRKVDESW